MSLFFSAALFRGATAKNRQADRVSVSAPTRKTNNGDAETRSRTHRTPPLAAARRDERPEHKRQPPYTLAFQSVVETRVSAGMPADVRCVDLGACALDSVTLWPCG
jgi:hypothetical protein